ncbi:MAG: tetratricopeptide repeat protein [Rhodobacterales bacterium]
MTDPLTKLAISYGTDKFGYHDYTPNYYKLFKHLRQKPVRLLEIGVGGYQDADRGGESLEVWRDFFPKGKIIGIDIQTKEMDLGERVQILKGSQVDPEFLEQLVAEHGPFDIIIDDGSHQNLHVVTSFELLYPTLAPGGIYVAEDVQTSFFPRFGGSIEMTQPNSVGFFSRKFQDFDGDDSILAMERFHNMVAVTKPKARLKASVDNMLADLPKGTLTVLEIGKSEKNSPLSDALTTLKKAKRTVLAVRPNKTAIKALLKDHGSFDVVIDHGEGKASAVTDTLEALYPHVKTGGTYLLGGLPKVAADYVTNLFVQVDHREIVVNFPDTPINPLVKEIYEVERIKGVTALQKKSNDYPSNFGFDFKHPLALAAFDVMEKVLDETGKERGLLLFSDIMTRGKYEDRAAKMLNRLGDMKAHSRVFYNMAVRQKKVDKNWDDALEMLQEAVVRYPEDYRIRSQLGASLMKARDWDAAEAEFNKAVELNARDPLLRIQLANALSQQGRLEDAVASAAKGCELSPAHAGHHVQLGRLQIMAGMVDEAVETLSKAIELNPDVPNAHRQISKAFAEQGRDSDALKAVGRALELYPDNQEYKRWQEKLAAA